VNDIVYVLIETDYRRHFRSVFLNNSMYGTGMMLSIPSVEAIFRLICKIKAHNPQKQIVR